MKLTIPANELARATKWAAVATERKGPPEASAVHMSADENGLTVYCAGYDRSRRTYIAGGVSEPGEIVVHAGLLTGLAGKLPAGDATLTAADRGLELVCGSVRARLTRMDVTPWQMAADGPTITADGGALARAMARVAVAGEEHYGVLVRTRDGAIELFATDRYRVGRATIPWDGQDEHQVVVPMPATDWAWLSGPATLTLGDGLLSLTAGDATETARLLDIPYPPVDPVIDRARSHDTTDIRVPATELLAAIDRASLASRSPVRVRVHVEADGVEILGLDNEDDEIRETVPAKVDGPERRACYAADYLTDAIKATADGANEIFWHIPEGNKACRFEVDGDNSYEHVLMCVDIHKVADPA